MRRGLVAFCAVLCLTAQAAPPVLAQGIRETWDHLVRVDSKKLRAVYLLPGTDFSVYRRVMIDPPEAAFRKNWLRDFNRSNRSVSRRLSDDDAQRALTQVSTSMQAALTRAFTEGGYQVVTTPAPDVLRIRTAVIDLSVNAPDIMSAGRSRSFAPEAGTGTLVIEAKDSLTGAVIGRAVDGRVAGDMGGMMRQRSSVSNRADFESMFRTWSRAAVNGLNVLRSTPPAAAGKSA